MILSPGRRRSPFTGSWGSGKGGRWEGEGGQAARASPLLPAHRVGSHHSPATPPSTGPLLTLIPMQESAPCSLPHPLLGRGVQCRIPAPQLCWPGWESTGCLTSANPACASSSSSARSSWVSFARRKQVSHCCTSRASSRLMLAEHSPGLKRHCALWFWALALHCVVLLVLGNS